MMTTIPPLMRRTFLGTVAACLAAPSMLRAQNYPSKPIRVVVPFSAGSSPDVIARYWGERISQILGQPVVIDNRPGAATIVGAQIVSTAPADGYTLLYTSGSTLGINPFIYSKLAYNTEDFAPIVRVASVPYVLVVSSTSPFRSVTDLVRAAKEKPEELTYASYGNGTTTHAVFARFTNVAGVKMTHVAYKNGGITDVMSGQVNALFDPSTTAIPLVKSGRLRALAVTSSSRLDALPNVPPISDFYPGEVADGFHALLAPRGVAIDVIEALSLASNKVIKSEEFRLRALELGLQPAGGSPAEFQRFIADDAKLWSKVVKDNNIRAD
jgi:tripartite-type tricarboxylate transporter receptor subunit TctC